jgi:hypothetical protein
VQQEYCRTRYRFRGRSGGLYRSGQEGGQGRPQDYGEVRYNMLAKVQGRVFHITFTERGGILWIISARKANQREQRRYEQG